MNPSGVQLASAIVPPGLQTRSSSPAAWWWFGREHRAEDRRDCVERLVGERQRFGVALDQLDRESLRGRTHATTLEQLRHVVDADDGTAESGRGDSGVAAAGGNVKHSPPGVQIRGVSELFRDRHDPRRNDGEVAARPRLLLALLDGLEVGRRCFDCLSHVLLLLSV